jgi:predicted Zn-dependent protease
MKFPHTFCRCHAPTRRAAIAMLAAAPLAACDRDSDDSGWNWPINLVSPGTVAQLGRQTWDKILASTPRASDPANQAKVARVSRALLDAASEDAAQWQVALFASPQVNAFALPGKRIGVFEGMLRVADTPARLAAVIGHEIGHIRADHPQERMNAQAAREWGIRLLFFALEIGDVAHAREIAAVLGAGVDFGLLLPYSRRQELEADRIGVRLMAQAGFDGREAAELWRRMDAMVPAKGPTFLATHPAPQQRIAALEKLAEAKAPR